MSRPFSTAPRRETLRYQNQSLHYTLVFRSRRTIGFAVRPDGSVHISAPAGTSPEWVAQQVLKKADWILRHQQTFASRPAPAPTRLFGHQTRQRRAVIVEMHLLHAVRFRRIAAEQVADILPHARFDLGEQITRRRIQRVVEIENPVADMG